MKNCVTIGWSRPSCARMSATSLGVGVVAGDDGRRIARRQPQHQEHEHGDDHHDGDRREQAAGDVGEHAEATVAVRGQG